MKLWHLFGSEYAGDDTWFSTHIVSSNDKLEVEMQMDYEGTQGQFKEMVIVHTDELDEEFIEEVLS